MRSMLVKFFPLIAAVASERGNKTRYGLHGKDLTSLGAGGRRGRAIEVNY